MEKITQIYIQIHGYRVQIDEAIYDDDRDRLRTGGYLLQNSGYQPEYLIGDNKLPRPRARLNDPNLEKRFVEATPFFPIPEFQKEENEREVLKDDVIQREEKLRRADPHLFQLIQYAEWHTREDFFNHCLEAHSVELTLDQYEYLRLFFTDPKDKIRLDEYLVAHTDAVTLLHWDRIPTRLYPSVAEQLIKLGEVDELLQLCIHNSAMLAHGFTSRSLLYLDEVSPPVARQVVDMHEELMSTRQKQPTALVHYYLKHNDMSNVTKLVRYFRSLDVNDLPTFIRTFTVPQLDKLDQILPVLKDVIPAGELRDAMDVVVNIENVHGSPSKGQDIAMLCSNHRVELNTLTLESLRHGPPMVCNCVICRPPTEGSSWTRRGYSFDYLRPGLKRERFEKKRLKHGGHEMAQQPVSASNVVGVEEKFYDSRTMMERLDMDERGSRMIPPLQKP